MSQPAKKARQKSAKGFTDEERAAMKERAKELKAEARANKNKVEGENDVLAKIGVTASAMTTRSIARFVSCSSRRT